MKLYVGTYTRPAPYLAETNGKGLYVLHYDEASGGVSIVQEVEGIENPSYLCISPDGRNLHAIWEVLEWPEGLVSSYAIEPSSGAWICERFRARAPQAGSRSRTSSRPPRGARRRASRRGPSPRCAAS